KESLSFPEAIEFLANRINYKLPEQTSSRDEALKKEIREQLWEIHKAAARYFYDCLNGDMGKPAMDYLKMRGITKAARTKFGIGYAPDSWDGLYNHLTEKGFSQEMIAKSGLAKQGSSGKYYDRFRNRVIFPIIDAFGHVIAFGGRRLTENKEEAKYLNSPDTDIFSKSYNPYNLNLAKLSRADEFILVEGYMDVISLYQAGFTNAIAACGTAFNEKHAGVIKRYTRNIIALFDSDEAGENAALKAIPVLKKAGIKMKILQVPNAKDPDEYIKNFGAEAFAKLLKTAVNPTIFRINVLKKQFSPDDPDDVITFSQKVVDILAETDNMSEIDVYINTALKDIPVSPEALRADIRRIKGITEDDPANGKELGRRVKNVVTSNAVEEAKSGLISLLADDKTLMHRIAPVFDKKEFADELYIKIYDVIERLHAQDKPAAEADVLALLELDGEKDAKRASLIFMSQLPCTTPEQRRTALIGDIKKIKEHYIDLLMSETDDDEQVMKLINEKKNIDNTLKALTL
ncbi:MAG: DNA primase, partial [Firmicutes bacterium]|nr:DNA primase [Bacillota bacterium]